MNLKKAKLLRKKAKQLACEFVKDKVLSSDLTEGVDCSKLIHSLPLRTTIMSHTGHKVAVGTMRWWIKQAKKHPNSNYEYFKETMYGSAK